MLRIEGLPGLRHIEIVSRDQAWVMPTRVGQVQQGERGR